MGVIDGLRNAYFSLEDRYYAALDWVEAKGVPVYKVVDAIDSVVPSFALFILLILLLIGGLSWAFVIPALSGPTAGLSVTVMDFADQPIAGAKITVYNGSSTSLAVSDALGKARFDLPRDSVLRVNVSREGFEPFDSGEFTLSQDRDLIARLSAAGSLGGGVSVTRTLRFLSQAGQPVTGESIRISFACATPGVQAPTDISTTESEVQVTEPANCNGLVADVVSQNFEAIHSQLLSQEINTFYLKPNSASLDGDRATLDVVVTVADQPAPDGIDILLYAQQ
jgi:hypothetical protein